MKKLTLEQVKELEDKIVNMLTPVYGKISRIPDQGLMREDINIMLGHLDRVVSYIRSLRPKKHQLTQEMVDKMRKRRIP